MTIARRGAVGPLLRRATIAAAATSLPLGAVGILFPSQLLGAMSHEFAPYGSLLVVLVAGRLVDACTGPSSEALIVGGRVRLELANLCVFVATVIVACAVLEPAFGVDGLAAAIALGTVACSLPRVFQVRRALRTTWRSDEPAEPHRTPAPIVAGRGAGALALVALCALLHGAVAGGLLDAASGLGLLLVIIATTLLTLAVAVVEARRRSAGAWTAVVVSPLAGALVAWVALFAWRPLSLWLWPSDTTLALTAIGYTPADLTRAAAIGGLGCAMWTFAYLALLGRTRAALPVPQAAGALTRASMWTGIALIAFGSALVALLFARQGGFAVLASAPGRLHNEGSGSGYAVLGVWIVQAVALRGLVGVLSGDGPRARRLLALGSFAAVLASVAMQARGLLFLGLVAAGVIVLCLRTPSRRAIAATVAVGVVAVAGSAFAQQIRSYSQATSPGQAVTLALKTPPGTFLISDLSVFDNLVALEQLVPGSVERLEGSTLAAVPLAFVPRALWPEKPLPLDQQVTEVLYPGVPAGGSPVGMQGELLWNFGLAGVVLGALIIGALMGLLARARRRIRGPGGYALYAVAIASVVAPLTRAFAPMATNTAMALLGVLLVAGAMGPRPRRACAVALARARALLEEAPVRPSAGALRLPAIDGLRALAATLVVAVHVGAFAAAPDPAPLSNLVSAFAQFAVTIFFTVTAFVLYRPFIAARAAGAPEPALGQFLIRRLVRILPAYWLLLTVLALFGGASGALSDDWWRYYFLLQIYTTDPLLPAGGIAPAWTLAVEVSFYFLLVAVAVLMRRRWAAASTLAARWRGELLVPCAFFALGAIPWILALDAPDLVYLRTTLAGTVGWFAAGMACAVLSVRAEHGIRPAWPVRALRDHPALCWAAGAGAIAWIATVPRFPLPDGPPVTITPLEGTLIVLAGVLAGMLCCAPILLGASGRIVRSLSTPLVAWLGVVCYGTYLIHHGLVLLLLAPWHGVDDQLLKTFIGFAIILPLAVATGAASWYLVERPLVRAAARALRSRRTRRAEVGPGAPVRSAA
jgi:peptidoglycan/LPS O-acetylase OafA/YrhL